MDSTTIRAEFPALALEARAGTIRFDNPAGTQMAARALRRMTSAITDCNANLGGHFDASVRASGLVDAARRAAADLVNATDSREIVFGPSMTALTFSVARALGRNWLKPGDEILLTRMDHDANVAPWLRVAGEMGLTIRWLDFDRGSFEFDLTRLDAVLTDRVRVAAVGLASNITGTINDARTIARRARDAGAVVYVDAVQFAPHAAVDVQELGCDFLACSAYKFYGPHQGILWGRLDLLDALPSDKVRPAANISPGRWEMGSKSREALAGVLGATEHIAWCGTTFGGAAEAATAREKIVAGMRATAAHERVLTAKLIHGLRDAPGLRIQGITEEQDLLRRLPTVSFTVDGVAPAEISRAMAAVGIAIWDGDNYAIEPVRWLGLQDRGGVARVGMAQYNTVEEIDAFLGHLSAFLRRR